MSKRKNRNNQEQGPISDQEENKADPKGVVVLGVFIHCEGCSETVLKHLRSFDGVEGVEVDAKNHKVIVKGKKVDPLRVTERLRRKTGKHVELISPIPSKEKKEQKKENKQEPKPIEVVLKMHLHCEGCARDVKKCIHKMPGVQMVEPNMKRSIVLVKGVFEPPKLVEFITKRTWRHVTVSKTDKEEKARGNKDQNERNKGGNKESVSVFPNYPPEVVFPPMIFSDENPNACSVM